VLRKTSSFAALLLITVASRLSTFLCNSLWYRAQNLNLKLTPGINKSNAWKKGGKARTGTSQKVQTQEIMVYFSKDFHPSDRTFPTADKWQSTCFSRPAIFHPRPPPKKKRYEMERHFIFGPAQDYGQIKIFLMHFVCRYGMHIAIVLGGWSNPASGQCPGPVPTAICRPLGAQLKLIEITKARLEMFKRLRQGGAQKETMWTTLFTRTNLLKTTKRTKQS